MKVSFNGRSVTFSNNENTHKYMKNNYDLSDFKWYRNKDNHKVYLAAFVSSKKARTIAKRCQLFDVASVFGPKDLSIVPKIKGFLACPLDEWLILRVDNRTYDRLISMDAEKDDTFKRNYAKVDEKRCFE